MDEDERLVLAGLFEHFLVADFILPWFSHTSGADLEAQRILPRFSHTSGTGGEHPTVVLTYIWCWR